MTGAADDISIHAMTCDVEDYFQVSAFESVIDRKDWPDFDCRIPRNMDRILAHFADANATGTFFILGWVAREYPEIVRRVVSQGHEVASHGMYHKRVWQQAPEEFLDDVVSARRLLEDIAGVEVTGYRAPSWSIGNRTPWAHEMLAEAGYQYSSSIYPARHDLGHTPDTPQEPHVVDGTGILEIPVSVVSIGGQRIPASGGGFFRLFPLSVSDWLIRRARSATRSPYIFYFHPWEIDPGQPRVGGLSLKTRFRHYFNLEKTEARLVKILGRFRWERMDRLFLGSEAT